MFSRVANQLEAHSNGVGRRYDYFHYHLGARLSFHDCVRRYFAVCSSPHHALVGHDSVYHDYFHYEYFRRYYDRDFRDGFGQKVADDVADHDKDHHDRHDLMVLEDGDDCQDYRRDYHDDVGEVELEVDAQCGSMAAEDCDRYGVEMAVK